MAKFKTLAEFAEERWEENAQLVRERYRMAVRPLYRRLSNGRPEQVASCVLVEIDKVRCLVTAAHVLDDTEAGLHLGVPPDFVPLNATFDASVKIDGDRGRDHVDIAVARLDDAVLAATAHLPFVAMPDQWAEPPAGPRVYLVLGYRASQNPPPLPGADMLTPTIWTYKGVGATLPDAAERLGEGASNFAIDYPKKGRRRNGELVPNTKPKGVSGGAIFDIGGITDLDLHNCQSGFRPQLAGIFIEASTRKKVLIGTHVSVVHDVVAASAPATPTEEDSAATLDALEHAEGANPS